jgi:hypothetical protein
VRQAGTELLASAACVIVDQQARQQGEMARESGAGLVTMHVEPNVRTGPPAH